MSQPTEQIYDGRGNKFIPSKDQQKLHKAGWRVYSRRKVGCMWRIQWISPTTREVYSQGVALEFLRQDKRNAAIKNNQ
jgi:hypothetical protein